jgi:hypothetical protein
MHERRSPSERRNRPKVTDRRSEERRDSPRTQIAYDFKEPNGLWRSTTGDLSVEGASFITTAPPVGDVIVLKVSIPTFAVPLVALGTIVSRVALREGAKIGLKFTDIGVEPQLAIAEWVEFKSRARA